MAVYSILKKKFCAVTAQNTVYVTRFSAPNFKFESRTQHRKKCLLCTLRFVLKQTAQLPEVCLEDALGNDEQLKDCRVPFIIPMGTQSFDLGSWMPQLQHCMGMMSLSACRPVLGRACVCFYHLWPCLV